MCISPSPRSCLTCIRVPRFMSHLHAGLTPMQVTPHRHPGPENCISAPCWSHLTSIQGSGCGFHLHASPSSPYSRCISAPPRSQLTYINVWRIASHLHSGTVSHQTPKNQIRASPLSDAAHVVFHIVLNVPV